MLADLEMYIVDNRLVASALRFVDWLLEHSGAEIVLRRREREVSARELDEASGAREALRIGARGELPTLPDPNSDRPLPAEAFPEHSQKTLEVARPSALSISLLILLFLLAGALA